MIAILSMELVEFKETFQFSKQNIHKQTHVGGNKFFIANNQT
jgi:hypothetical protein